MIRAGVQVRAGISIELYAHRPHELQYPKSDPVLGPANCPNVITRTRVTVYFDSCHARAHDPNTGKYLSGWRSLTTRTQIKCPAMRAWFLGPASRVCKSDVANLRNLQRRPGQPGTGPGTMGLTYKSNIHKYWGDPNRSTAKKGFRRVSSPNAREIWHIDVRTR